MSDTPINNLSRYAAPLLSAGISLILFSVLAGKTTLWALDGPMILPSGSYGTAFGILLVMGALALWYTAPKGERQALQLDPLGATAGVALIFFSDWLCRNYNLFQGPVIRGELILGILAAFVLLRLRSGLFYFAFMLFSIAIVAYNFFTTADGRMLISDDHASFVFRLMALKENFPHIPFYCPLWNGGFDARDFFATGALNIFLLLWPIIYAFNVPDVYNVLVAIVLFGVLPFSVFISARLCKLAIPTPAIAAVLALGSNLLWYRWALKYGTMGFVTSIALLPIVFALTIKILAREEQLSRIEAMIFVVATSLMLCWTPSGLVFVPAAVLGLIFIRSILHKRYLIAIAATLLILNAPWMAVFVSVSKVGNFVQSERPSDQSQSEGSIHNDKPKASAPVAQRSKAAHVSGQGTLRLLREYAIGANPLILFLALPGLLLLRGATRSLFIITTGWLIILGAVLVPLKPQLELDRMLIIMGILLSLPAARALSQLMAQAQASSLARLPVSLCLGFLLITPFTLCGVVNNHSIEQYYFSSPLVSDMTSAIKRYGGPGRVLFSGFVLHDLSNGHLAPLAYLSGKSLIASSPFHSQWNYGQVFPKSFIERMESDGIIQYLDLYNVSAVFAHERQWREYFGRRPAEFRPVWQGDKFSLFTRTSFPGTLYVQGTGEEPHETSNSVVLRPAQSEVVLRYNYLPFLEASGCTISGQQMAPEVTFIKLSGCTPGAEVVIRAKHALERIAQ